MPGKRSKRSLHPFTAVLAAVMERQCVFEIRIPGSNHYQQAANYTTRRLPRSQIRVLDNEHLTVQAQSIPDTSLIPLNQITTEQLEAWAQDRQARKFWVPLWLRDAENVPTIPRKNHSDQPTNSVPARDSSRHRNRESRSTSKRRRSHT